MGIYERVGDVKRAEDGRKCWAFPLNDSYAKSAGTLHTLITEASRPLCRHAFDVGWAEHLPVRIPDHGRYVMVTLHYSRERDQGTRPARAGSTSRLPIG